MMNTENFNMDQMRKAWIEMGEALGMNPLPGSNPNNLDKKKTALDRLRDKYRIFWIVSLLMTFGSFMIFSQGQIVDSRFNLWLGIAYAVYFLTVSSMDFWLWRGISSIDPLRMSVNEIAEKSMYYRKRHLQFMAIVIPMVIGLLGFTGYVYSANLYFLNGMIVGIIAGAIIGTIQFRRFMSEYRHLT